MKSKLEDAKVQYANAKVLARDKYDEMKLKNQGYGASLVVDNTETGSITQFENDLPLQRVALDDFERRIKKLVDSETGDEVTLRQMVECFKDNPFLAKIEEEGSLIRTILTDPTMQKKEGTYHIPYLMLVGILYCASNTNVKA